MEKRRKINRSLAYVAVESDNDRICERLPSAVERFGSFPNERDPNTDPKIV